MIKDVGDKKVRIEKGRLVWVDTSNMAASIAVGRAEMLYITVYDTHVHPI
jgi:predicted ribosome-associated RNA-binding protein Tma20